MPAVQDITSLTFGDKTYNVEEMSDTVKQLVYFYNKATREAAEMHDKLVLLNAAREQISRDISGQVGKEEAEAKAAKEATEAPPAP